MSAPHRLAGSVARIVRVCDDGNDTRALRLDVLDEIRSTVPFEAHAWLLTDPETAVGTAPLADVPCLPQLTELIRLKYLDPINRWTSLGEVVVATLQGSTGGDLSQSILWRAILSTYDIGDVASLVFEDRFGCWGFLDLWRSGPGARFSDDETSFLATIASPLTAALRRGQAATFVAPATGTQGRPSGPVVLMLTPDLEVLGETPASSDYLHVLVPPEIGASPVPASAYNAGAQLLALEAGVDPNPASARMHLAGGVWVTVRAGRLADGGRSDRHNIAVTIEETVPGDRLAVFARASGLSRRETELIELLATGTDTREVARRMFLAEYTVQDHLKSVFAKTNTRSRRGLLAGHRHLRGRDGRHPG